MSAFRIGKIDLSQIECRILNTVAGQWDVVEKFGRGVDLYSELASQFYGYPVDKSKPAERGTGKQLELSCGYGAGAATIVRTARAGAYGPPVRLTLDQGLQARDLYRNTHPNVVQLWEYGNFCLHYLRTRLNVTFPLATSSCLEIKDGRIFHPCGLWLDYTSLDYGANINRQYGLELDEKTLYYRVREGWRKMYGGRFVENVIQWLASIPIRYRMVEINRRFGWRIPLTVHDDIFMLVPNTRQGLEDFEIAKAMMAAPLDWLPECPIACEGELMDALDK
jgi:DNA polymerase family A